MIESEVETLLNNLNMPVSEMMKRKILPGRTYWQIYNWLATHGYSYDFKLKGYVYRTAQL